MNNQTFYCIYCGVEHEHICQPFATEGGVSGYSTSCTNCLIQSRVIEINTCSDEHEELRDCPQCRHRTKHTVAPWKNEGGITGENVQCCNCRYDYIHEPTQYTGSTDDGTGRIEEHCPQCDRITLHTYETCGELGQSSTCTMCNHYKPPGE